MGLSAVARYAFRDVALLFRLAETGAVYAGLH
jgi:hypothetical protein